MSHRILLVDDEVDILEFVSYNLRREGYEVHTAANGRLALADAVDFKPHLIILDTMMPEMDGIATCAAIRAIPALSDTMIVFLSALGQEESQIAAYKAGADDYISKPVRVKILVSRVNALLKRIDDGQSEPQPTADVPQSSISIDKERYLVIKDGVEIVMPRKEFSLFSLLFSKPQKVFSRKEIYQKVWGSGVVVGDRTIDVHIRKLREKLGDRHIVTIKGVGYKYEE